MKKLNLTNSLSNLIYSSVNEAKELGDEVIYTEHILLALVKNSSNSSINFEDSNELIDSLLSLLIEKRIKDKNNKLLLPSQTAGGILCDYGSDDNYYFSLECSDLFDNIDKKNFLKEIDVADFIVEVMESKEILSMLLRSHGVTDEVVERLKNESKNSFFEDMISGLFNINGNKMSAFPPFGGMFKAKKLSQDNSKEGDNNPFNPFMPSSDSQSFSSMFGGDRDEDEEEPALGVDPKSIDKEIPYLSKYGFDMCKAAKEGKYDPVVGRESELQELIEILSCRKKNNALLLGDPGTGKTSIIEGLAQRISESNVPANLLGKRIFSLDLNSLVAGTKYRGQYEERLQGIIKDVVSHKDVIVYIDEFHNLVGNGSSSGSGDGSNILKPYLARGEFQCIGATTSSEYKKFVEKDGALKRRFQNIMIYQPSDEETLTILKNIKTKYEQYHGVSYSDDILKDCVKLSGQYVTDRFFPDKAIDIMDMSGARTKLDNSSGCTEKIKAIEKNLEQLKRTKKLAVSQEDYVSANNIRTQEKELELMLAQEKESTNSSHYIVNSDTVSKVIEKISGVPSNKIGQSDMDRLRDMKTTLQNIVIGQDEAVRNTVLALQRNALGLRDPNKPIASFMMIGPTGSGKTYICKTIAEEFFGTKDALIRFDMSEFSEKHEITKLLGSTASYVGYDDEPLFEKVRNRPHCVVLFDVIEKAAQEIYQVFLNILDEGSVTLGNGVQVNFKNSIIIFTGNIGTKELGVTKVGFNEKDQTKKDIEDITKKALKKTFSPEFINRLSKIIVFNKLSEEDLGKICIKEIEKLSDRLKTQGYTLSVAQDMIDKIVSECDKVYGARDLQRNIIKLIEEPVCDELLKEGMADKKNISVSSEKIELT